MIKDSWFLELNENQQKAVSYNEGPLFVVAGAGTGKTKTLTSKIAYLIKYQNINPHEILAVTFTNKAAREMKERVIKMIGPKAEAVWLYTFHAFALQILRRDIHHLNNGLNNYFNIADDDDSKKLVSESIEALNFDKKSYTVRTMRNKISHFKTFGRKTIFSDDHELKIYEQYQKILINNNLVDFDDLLLYTYELFSTNIDVLKKYQKQFKYVLIDEFQDTNKIQYEIAKMLVLEHQKIFVVGDPDQSIYSFRGADYENNKRFQTDFPGEKILDLNYRSNNNILKKANSLIKHNELRPFIHEGLKSNIHSFVHPINYVGDNDYQEANYIMLEIESLIRQFGYRYDDFAILYRNNSLSRIFEDTLIQAGMPYQIYGGISFYERKEIKDILAYVRLIVNPHLNFYFKRVVNVPRRKIGAKTIETLESYANSIGTSLYDAIETAPLNKGALSNLLNFKNLLNSLIEESKKFDKLKDIVTHVIKEVKYIEMLEEDGDDFLEDRVDNLNELKSVFGASEFLYSGTLEEKLIDLLNQISLYTDLDRKKDFTDKIILSTYHQVKGLEFKVVFLVAMEEGIFPSDRSLDELEDLEEERRICYVGITRAKERLYFTSSRRRMMYGYIQNMIPSRFIKESFNEESKTNIKVIKSQKGSSIYKAGDKVVHEVFEEGVVVGVDSEVITIAFKNPHGLKKIIDNHPSLKKL